MKWHYLPNAITATRFLMIIPFLYFILEQNYLPAFYIFILASISDGLDGFLARRFQWQSEFGAFADPLADKFLVLSSYIAFTLFHQVPLWFGVLMVSRDIVIIGGATAWYRLFKKIDFRPTLVSKINTVFQLLLVIVLLFQLAFGVLIYPLPLYLITITTLTTAFSFVDYVLCWSIRAYKQKK